MKDITQELIRSLFKYSKGKLYWIKPTANKIKIGDTPKYKSSHGYYKVQIMGKPLFVHRLIFLYHNGYMPKMIDHINGVRTDNRIDNLRPCTASQNAVNSIKKQNNTSGTKGVNYNKSTKNWIVRITKDKKRHYVGSFKSKLDASIAAINARRDIQGEFTNNN